MVVAAAFLPGWLGGLVNLAALLALGAVLRNDPWRAGGIAAVPLVVAMVLDRGLSPLRAVGVTLVAVPFVLVGSALVSRAGSMLVAADEEGTAEPGAGGRRGRFDTKARRGRFLVVLGIAVALANGACSAWGTRAADQKAAAREAEIRRALDPMTADQVMPRVLAVLDSSGEGLPGGPYRVIRAVGGGVEATAEVRAWTEERCVRARLSASGVVTTETSDGAC